MSPEGSGMVAAKKNCAAKLCRSLPQMAMLWQSTLPAGGEFARTLPKDTGDQGACQKFARKFSFLRLFARDLPLSLNLMITRGYFIPLSCLFGISKFIRQRLSSRPPQN